MLQNYLSIRQFRLTKWSILVHSTTRNASYIHPSHDSILELLRTFPNARAILFVVLLYVSIELVSYTLPGEF